MKLIRTTQIYAVCLAFTLTVLSFASADAQTKCRLEIYDIEMRTRSVVYEFDYIVEAPNWTKDGKNLIINSDGKLYSVAIDRNNEAKQAPKLLDTGFATRCNNDHVLSPAGDAIAVSHHSVEDGQSRIYIVPFSNSKPILITPMAPSYLHGWSPDGRKLAFCAERKGNYDVYAIDADGGVETRLTASDSLDDGPEYSPCGNYIWFNSVRTGLMQVWRMRVDGSEQEQITFHSDCNSWFPHVSPDNSKAVYLSYHKDDVEPGAHPFGKNVELRLINLNSGKSETIVKLFGGQGTINVNSWSPDSKKFAFVSYVQ